MLHCIEDAKQGDRQAFEHIRVLKVFPAYNESSVPFQNSDVVLTGFGKNVMDGNEDWVEKKGIDEWYGGVHLQGYFQRWRWNSSLQTIQDIGTEV
ncbi:hypothetical protein [Paenibacillus glacialis]|uniref:Uncharacterized protein n=1 Tax=Paenibacillus glacialis TaxID=494026 RepID=A0A162MDM5_9BACL|nr:hypothetical protein [Paenibacillus glacialis]OAB42653.1 hypothetical protein PGLA_11675 [Paenibacillus glacialis]